MLLRRRHIRILVSQRSYWTDNGVEVHEFGIHRTISNGDHYEDFGIRMQGRYKD